MIAVALARKLMGVKIVPVYPVMHRKPVKSNSVKFMSCHVAGSRQTTREYRKGTEVITLEFQAYIGA